MQENRVRLSIEKGVAFVTLNRPEKHNALDLSMFGAIDNIIKHIKRESSVRVVIVSGEGQSFCSGLDVKSLMSDKTGMLKLLWKWLPGNANLAQRVSVGWRRLKVPVIMALHGHCWGGGLQIALGGDYRIAAPDSSLSIMELRWGLVPDMGGTLALKEVLACDQAMKLAMTSDVISAQQAVKLNLVTQLSDAPKESAIALAEQLINRSPDSNKLIKAMYHRIWCANERHILARETISQIRILMGKNQRIAVKRELGQKEINYL